MEFLEGTRLIFSEFLRKKNLTIYGFDSFDGLEEEWSMNEYNPIGTFSLNKKKPKVSNNVKLIVGKVQETLENFLKENYGKNNFCSFRYGHLHPNQIYFGKN